ncbi:MAG: 4-hydroxythreonine-4-phosphate dehydrogenase PdxA [Phaeodactylibacter sp.]|nr:4-hydroxythreonine-4-phosphate dehydrogenase PdxA [Phaeodactylibacter sp.]MCB9052915.1 4-hydroxythreonine-4-phosphate dehydrogenase PdxA [Lewinellaceae bacterium]
MEKLKIGISIGDINGIGLEVILKTLLHEKITDICTPVIYGSSKVVSYHKNIIEDEVEFNSTRSADKIYFDKVNIVNCWQENVNITLGKPSDLSGKYAQISLEQATQDLKNGLVDALVTAPISKEAMHMANFPFPGHTEYLTKELGHGQSLMFMVNDSLRIGLATNHLPLREVAETLTKELIMQKLQLMNHSLKMDFGLERPSIAVLGLNPHAGDGGVLGNEEEAFIRPAIVELKKKGMLVMGPFPADGFFGSGQYRKFDAILAMYHDQGLVPFKALSFGNGVNFTAGLSHVRTSPDHGTAFDLAGKNSADPSSFRKALFLALDIARNRRMYQEMHADVVQKRGKMVDVDGEDEILREDED